MLISLSGNFVFVANLKTASTSIEAALRPHAELALTESRFGKHMTFSEIAFRFPWVLEMMDPGNCLIFGVIRDPVDYVVSLYRSHNNPKLKDAPDLYTGNLGFGRFLEEWVPRNRDQVEPQYLRFLDNTGRLATNYLISYDKLEEGMRFIGKRIGIDGPLSLPWENRSDAAFDPSGITAQQRRWIEAYFEGDREIMAQYCDRLLTSRPRLSSHGSGSRSRQAGPDASAAQADASKEGDEAETAQRAYVMQGSTMREDPLLPEVIRALYRVLLLREPDPPGFAAYMQQMQGGWSVEQAMRQMLRSNEFANKRAQFVQTHAGTSSKKRMEFEYVTHMFEGLSVAYALNKDAKDSYTESLRSTPPSVHFLPFVLRRARRKGAGFKFADFGANVGGVSLPLAAHSLRILSIEALPANFVALATAARVNGFCDLLPVNMAALDHAGLVSFSGTSAWATAGLGWGDVTVSCDTLVNILCTYGFADADVIKLDIEGAELPALSGADAFFADRPETEVIFESNNHTCRLFGYDRQDLLRWFEERGFSTYVFGEDGLMPVRHADPQPIPVVDILATKRPPEALERQGERIVPMTDDYVLRELLRISESTHPHVRAHFLTEAARVGDGVRNLPLWPKIASRI